jgi:hypothetical protein
VQRPVAAGALTETHALRCPQVGAVHWAAGGGGVPRGGVAAWSKTGAQGWAGGWGLAHERMQDKVWRLHSRYSYHC